MTNKTLLHLCFSCTLVIGISIAAVAQEGAARFQNGITIAVKTEVVPSENENHSLRNVSASIISSGETLHRVISDTKNKLYFGYDVKAIRESGSKMFRVSIRPLSIEPGKLLNGDGFRAQAPRKYPDDVVVADGDTITLETLENPQTKAKIVDIIKVTTEEHKFGSYYAERGPAKDFTLDDVNLHIDAPDVLINGENSKFSGSAAGNVVWIYIMGKGRFIFSFTPQANYNFQKIGTIEDNKILFDYDGISYRFTNKSPVLGTGGKWNLWVMFDADYKSELDPAGSSGEFGAADKIEYILGKKK